MKEVVGRVNVGGICISGFCVLVSFEVYACTCIKFSVLALKSFGQMNDVLCASV